MRLILIRHGQTVENAAGLMQGHFPGRLSNLGKAQAKQAGGSLRSEKIDALISSDLVRARQTATAIERECGVRAVLDPGLREKCYGIYEGRPIDDLLDAMRGDKVDMSLYCPDGGELHADFVNRAVGFLERAIDRYGSGTVAVVTHNGVIKVLLGLLLDRKFQGNGHDAIGNGDIVIVNIGEDGEARLENVISCSPDPETVLSKPNVLALA